MHGYGRWVRWIRNGVLISLGIHLAFLAVAASIVAIRSSFKPQATFFGDPPPLPRLEPRKLEMKVRVQDLQKSSARPRLQPRILAMSPTELGLPEIKTKPKPVQQKVRRTYASVGLTGIGQGIGGGTGTGAGGGMGGGIFGSVGEMPGAWEGKIYLFDFIGRLRTEDGQWYDGRNKRKQMGRIYTYSHNIPRRNFSEGFPGISDQFEWFAIEYEAEVVWPAALAGDYEFRVTVDDGAIFQIDRKDVIVADGLLGGRGQETVSGTASITPGKHRLQLYYFQGPRHAIALVFEYRKTGSGAWRIFDLREVQKL